MNGNIDILAQKNEFGTSVETKFLFEVAKKMPKINVEEMTIFSYHNVVGMTITDPENICGNAIAGAT